jgi:hypothetical protein
MINQPGQPAGIKDFTPAMTVASKLRKRLLVLGCLGTVIIREARGQTPINGRARILPPRLPHRPYWKFSSDIRWRRTYNRLPRLEEPNDHRNVCTNAYFLPDQYIYVIYMLSRSSIRH